MIPSDWRSKEVAVLGLGRSGIAAARWLAGHGVTVYASDVAGEEQLGSIAEQLRSASIQVDLGGHDVERVARAAAVVVSPGIPFDIPALRAARDRGIPVVAELDLAFQNLPSSQFVVVTGTNGKTTTTALIHHLLVEADLHAACAGNIGRPLIDLVDGADPPAWIVVEASSYQLHDAPHVTPAVGVLTNLAPDHLDRYGSVESYYADKKNLFANATAESVWVLNGDDPAVLDLARGVTGRIREWSLAGPSDAWLDRTRGELWLEQQCLLDRDRFALLGDHNVHNALAAILVADTVGVGRAQIADGLTTFGALPHRLETIRTVRDVRWINDSKATNVASAGAALRAMVGPYILLMGGRGKGEDFTLLRPWLGPRCRRLIVFGEAATALEDALRGTVTVTVVNTLDDAVRTASHFAEAGDTVLLSPACASFDQFRNYEERGTAFRHLVEAL